MAPTFICWLSNIGFRLLFDWDIRSRTYPHAGHKRLKRPMAVKNLSKSGSKLLEVQAFEGTVNNPVCFLHTKPKGAPTKNIPTRIGPLIWESLAKSETCGTCDDSVALTTLTFFWVNTRKLKGRKVSGIYIYIIYLYGSPSACLPPLHRSSPPLAGRQHGGHGDAQRPERAGEL